VDTPAQPPTPPAVPVAKPKDDRPFEQKVFGELQLTGVQHPEESDQLFFDAVNQREGEHVQMTALLKQGSGEPLQVGLALVAEDDSASPAFVRKASREVMKDAEIELLLVIASEFKPQVVDLDQAQHGSSALVVVGSSWLGSLRVLFVRVDAETLG